MKEKLGRIISGKSDEKGISFTTQNVTVTVRRNGDILYNSMQLSDEEKVEKYRKEMEAKEKKIKEESEIFSNDIKNPFEKKKRIRKRECRKKIEQMKKKFYENHPLLANPRIVPSTMQKIYILFELLLMIVLRVIDFPYIAIGLSSIFFLLFAFNLVKDAIHFHSIPDVKRLHGAEHKVFNAYMSEVNEKRKKVSEQSVICNYCGSNKIINIFFFETINLLLSIFFGVWIPHLALIIFCINYNRIVPGNFFIYFLQRITLKKPSANEIELAYFAIRLTLNVDTISFQLPITPNVFKLVILATIEEIKKDKNGEGIELPRCIRMKSYRD